MKPETQPTIEDVLAGRGAARQLFEAIAEFIKTLGPLTVVPRRTQVGFKRARMFAWIWLPQMWIKRRPKDSITLAFGLDRQVRDSRIKESVEPYPGRFTHHVVIENASDFDDKVKGWLREAYALAGQRRVDGSRSP